MRTILILEDPLPLPARRDFKPRGASHLEEVFGLTICAALFALCLVAAFSAF